MLDPALSARLTHQLSSFLAWIGGADPRHLAWTPPSGKWSALQNLAHVGRHHEVMRERLDRVLAEDSPTFPRYREADDPGWPAWEALPAEETLRRLRDRREGFVAFAGGLSPEQLRRTGTHAKFGPMDVSRWLEFFLVHEAHHLYVALQRLAEALGRGPVTRVRVAGDGSLPRYTSEAAAGADLHASEAVVIAPGDRAAVPTRIHLELPPGHVGLVWPRSGLALRHGIDTLAGVIDSDYRGEVRVVLVNHGREPFRIEPGDRIAQLLVQRVLRAEFVSDAGLTETGRGQGGFGSSG